MNKYHDDVCICPVCNAERAIAIYNTKTKKNTEEQKE